ELVLCASVSLCEPLSVILGAARPFHAPPKPDDPIDPRHRQPGPGRGGALLRPPGGRPARERLPVHGRAAPRQPPRGDAGPRGAAAPHGDAQLGGPAHGVAHPAARGAAPAGGGADVHGARHAPYAGAAPQRQHPPGAAGRLLPAAQLPPRRRVGGKHARHLRLPGGAGLPRRARLPHHQLRRSARALRRRRPRPRSPRAPRHRRRRADDLRAGALPAQQGLRGAAGRLRPPPRRGGRPPPAPGGRGRRRAARRAARPGAPPGHRRAGELDGVAHRPRALLRRRRPLRLPLAHRAPGERDPGSVGPQRPRAFHPHPRRRRADGRRRDGHPRGRRRRARHERRHPARPPLRRARAAAPGRRGPPHRAHAPQQGGHRHRVPRPLRPPRHHRPAPL
ncbi:MAG: hypothetical protein AVDCRST_MAG68-2535, partial [uncultured Gemmatimonadetes bacterium]